MFEFAKKPLQFKAIHSNGFSLYKSSFSKIWYFVTITALLNLISGYVNTKIYPISQISDFHALNEQGKMILAGLNLVDFIVSIYCMALVIIKMYDSNSIKKTNANIFKLAWNKLFTLTLFKLFFLLTFVIGMLLFFIPSIVSIVFFAFAPLLILIEDKGFFKSILESCKLVYGNWWRTLGIFTPIGLIFLSLTLLQMFLAKAYSNSVILLCLYAIVSIAFLPFICSILLVQFNDLNLRKIKND